MSNFAEQSETITAEEAPHSKVRDSLERRVFRSSVVVIMTFAAAYVLWKLLDLLLLLFACTLVSLILLTITAALRRRTNLPFGAALALTIFAIAGLLGAAVTRPLNHHLSSPATSHAARSEFGKCAAQISVQQRVPEKKSTRWLHDVLY